MTPGSNVPRLLVSVRDVAEAELCLRTGVDILDVKEPSRGSLGRADAETIQAIARLWDGPPRETGLSIALGELSQASSQAEPFVIPSTVRWVKLGLAGSVNDPGWIMAWRACRARWEAAAGRALDWIAVAYADHVGAEAPSVEAVLTSAIDTTCAGLLIDTWDKQRGGLTTHISPDELRRVVRRAHEAGLIVALAGKVQTRDFPELANSGADVIAVRSAACAEQNRTATIDSGRLRLCRAALSAP
jgi:hypothetical protein